jgi:hypothetical protein
MYENHKLCATLKPNEICLVVEQYKNGMFDRKYHEHIPKHRLSEDSLQHLLQALVLKFENNEPWTIVRSHLNERGKELPSYKFMWQVTYPEPGVLRKYCGSDTCALADRVIRAGNFSKTNPAH